jgi:pyruvate kinase
MPRTKIICTIGPASRSPEALHGLMEAGMDVARLNFSHGTLEEHGETIRFIREQARNLSRPIAILQDLAGVKIRVGEMAGGSALLETGATFTLTRKSMTGDQNHASVTYPKLPAELKQGDRLLLSDGSIELQVEATDSTQTICRVTVGGVLGSRKGVSVPGRTVGGSGLTDKDREDLAFGLQQGVDYVGLSFVRTAEDVETARKFITSHGADTPVIAKIENQEALDHFDAILESADGIMVARGDLGVGTPIARIPQVQKALIKKANRAAKPVITATDMLRSMVVNPRPTRAEVTDVANSILDGTDAVMLSEETAVGKYPTDAVRTMADVAMAAEASFPFSSWRRSMNRQVETTISGSIASAVCELSEDVDAAAILTCTSSGSTARSVVRFRPRRPVLALTPRKTTYRRLALAWGVMPRLIGTTDTTDELIGVALQTAADHGLLKPGDRAVLTAGVPAGVPGNTNLIKVEIVGHSD